MNETELNMIKDLFNNLNITHANDTKSFIEEIKNLYGFIKCNYSFYTWHAES